MIIMAEKIKSQKPNNNKHLRQFVNKNTLKHKKNHLKMRIMKFFTIFVYQYNIMRYFL